MVNAKRESCFEYSLIFSAGNGYPRKWISSTCETFALRGSLLLEYFPKEPSTVTDCPFFRKNDSVFPKKGSVPQKKVHFHAGAG
jgi:hypothetical protein